jgi:hypothetical protein
MCSSRKLGQSRSAIVNRLRKEINRRWARQGLQAAPRAPGSTVTSRPDLPAQPKAPSNAAQSPSVRVQRTARGYVGSCIAGRVWLDQRPMRHACADHGARLTLGRVQIAPVTTHFGSRCELSQLVDNTSTNQPLVPMRCRVALEKGARA